MRKQPAINNNFKHGLSNTPVYNTWSNMWARCTNPNDISYRFYGAVGIRVCQRWESFQNFFDDMGHKPTKDHSLDRKDSKKDYGPNNCRWSTEVEQQNNKKSNRIIKAFGLVKTIAEWSRHTGINHHTIRDRLKRGWKPENALTQYIYE